MRSARIVAVALALLGAGACSSDTTYSYFDVAVAVDTSTFSDDALKLVGKCLVSVTGSNVLGENFVLGNACLPGQTRADEHRREGVIGADDPRQVRVDPQQDRHAVEVEQEREQRLGVFIVKSL